MRKISILLVMIGSLMTVTLSMDKKEAEKIVREAIAAKKTIREQVQLLIEMAWFDPSQPPEVAAFAKEKLKGYQRESINVLRRAILEAPPSAQKEMIPILLAAYNHRKMRWDLEYAHTFSTLLKSPDREIKIMAMDALAKYNVPRVTLPIIDAIYEDPSLELYGIKTLGSIKDPKAAKFLMKKMASPDKTIADAAEEALSKMARKIPMVLKQGCLEEDGNIRERSLRLFLPIAKVDDLSFLYYVSSRKENFDHALLEKLKETIKKLEGEQATLAEKEESATPEESSMKSKE